MGTACTLRQRGEAIGWVSSGTCDDQPAFGEGSEQQITVFEQALHARMREEMAAKRQREVSPYDYCLLSLSPILLNCHTELLVCNL